MPKKEKNSETPSRKEIKAMLKNDVLQQNESMAEVLSSKLAYEGPLFCVYKEEIREPNGHLTTRDIIRHNGSVVILAIDDSESKKDPLVIMERQYRHAAGQYLWEVPAGKREHGEELLAAAKRELIEETGYRAEKWTEMVRYFASPGFLGEWMQVFLAEGLTAGKAEPEADETLAIYPIALSELDTLIDRGLIIDGKTLVAISMYKRLVAGRKKESKKN
jgi:ADP-ribose pyrophosphatase